MAHANTSGAHAPNLPTFEETCASIRDGHAVATGPKLEIRRDSLARLCLAHRLPVRELASTTLREVFYPLGAQVSKPALEAAIAQQGGNGIAAYTALRGLQPRCLDTYRDPLQARPLLLAPHHWTSVEFDHYLHLHRFPGNTHEDRHRCHFQAVVDALVNGLYVPKVVLEDPALKGAVADAIMHVRCSQQQAEAALQHAELQVRFEQRIGYLESTEVYIGRVADLLLQALKPGPEIQRVSNGIVVAYQPWREFELAIRFDAGRRPTVGSFGVTDSGRPPALLIHPKHSLYGLHRVDWESCGEPALASLLERRKLSLDLAWFLMGVGWTPSGWRRGTVTSSDSRSTSKAVAVSA